MLKNRLPHKEYKELEPTVILRKSKGRINVMKIVYSRLMAIRARKVDHPIYKGIANDYKGNHKYGKHNKGGYPLNRNGMPLNSNGRNALAR